MGGERRRPRPLSRRLRFLGNPCCGDNSLPLVPFLLRSRTDAPGRVKKGGETEVPQGAIYLLSRVPACDVRYGGQEDAGSVRQDAPFCYHLVCAGPPSAREEGRDGQNEGPSALGEIVLSSKEPFTMGKLRPLAPHSPRHHTATREQSAVSPTGLSWKPVPAMTAHVLPSQY